MKKIERPPKRSKIERNPDPDFEVSESTLEATSEVSKDLSSMTHNIRLVGEGVLEILNLSYDSHYGDTSIICRDKSVVRAPRLLLILGSKYFHSMFDDCCSYDTIILPDFNKDTVEDCINYLTKGVYESFSEERFQSLSELLKLLGIPFRPTEKKKIDKNFVCNECGKILTSKYNLRRHITKFHLNPSKRVEKPKEFICDHCGRIFKDKFVLRNHISVIHINTEKNEECPICFKKFKGKRNLNAHQIVHEGKKYVCETCGKQVKTKVALARHLETHIEVRPFQCHLCPKSYNSSRFLKHHHQAAHTEARPFPCDECNKAFKFERLLKRHRIVVHEATKSIHCRLCPYSCTDMNRITMHLIVHSGSKPYHCSKCQETFKHKEEGRRHARAKHPDSKAVIGFTMNESISKLMETAVRTSNEPLDEGEEMKDEETDNE